jgi:hypothetical protein
VHLALLCAGILAGSSAASYAQSRTERTNQPIAESARAAAASSVPEKFDAPTTQEPEAGRLTRLQLGIALKSSTSPGGLMGNELGPSFVWRWRGKDSRQDDRLAFAYRLSAFSSRVSSELSAGPLPVGDVRIRPLMIGADYKMPRGKWQWAVGVAGGWAVNNVETPGAYRELAARTAGAADLWVDVHNSFVWGPRLKGWSDRDRRVSYLVEAAYLVTRPEFDIRARGVTTSRRLNADALIVKVGIAYGIF